jgi:cell division septum initiation protein DivIVA
VRVGRSLFGYNRATVEQLIEEVAQSFEATWRERGELADKVETLEKQIAELRGREHLLTQTLVAAEQAASDVRERARREAETIVEEAHNEARAIGRSAHAERERLRVESKRIEGMLRGALGMIETEKAVAPAPVQKAPAVQVPIPVAVPEPVAQHEPEQEREPQAEVGWEAEHEPQAEHDPQAEHEWEAEHEPVTQFAPEPEPAVEPIVEHLPASIAASGLFEEHEAEIEQEIEPELEPVVHRLPPAPVAEPHVESEYGWAREDTREFEPISGLPEPEPDVEHVHDEPSLPVAEPVLERIPGAGSRDFDWGE